MGEFYMGGEKPWGGSGTHTLYIVLKQQEGDKEMKHTKVYINVS